MGEILGKALGRHPDTRQGDFTALGMKQLLGQFTWDLSKFSITANNSLWLKGMF